MASRKTRKRRQRRDAFGQPAARPPRPGAEVPPGTSRSEARAIEARAELEPLEPGERPTAVTIGAIIAGVIGVANLVLLATGYEVQGNGRVLTDRQKTINDVQSLAISVVTVVMAIGMWRMRYWAVLGFQALLALTCIFAGMSLLVASNVQAVLLCLAVLGLGGSLFWFLVKAMARIQMPERPGARQAKR